MGIIRCAGRRLRRRPPPLPRELVLRRHTTRGWLVVHAAGAGRGLGWRRPGGGPEGRRPGGAEPTVGLSLRIRDGRRLQNINGNAPRALADTYEFRIRILTLNG